MAGRLKPESRWTYTIFLHGSMTPERQNRQRSLRLDFSLPDSTPCELERVLPTEEFTFCSSGKGQKTSFGRPEWLTLIGTSARSTSTTSFPELGVKRRKSSPEYLT